MHRYTQAQGLVLLCLALIQRQAHKYSTVMKAETASVVIRSWYLHHFFFLNPDLNTLLLSSKNSFKSCFDTSLYHAIMSGCENAGLVWVIVKFFHLLHLAVGRMLLR